MFKKIIFRVGGDKIFTLIAVSLFLVLSSSGHAEGEGTPEKVLGPENVMVTLYALGGAAAGQKTYGEEIYLSKGTPLQALITLKQIVLEGKKPSRSFEMKDQLEVIVFRGSFLKLSKIAIKKVVLKDSSIEVYAEYKDLPGAGIASQPAAIIPVGQLPPGKYTVILFVDNKLRKKAEFSVSR
ncbi:MAG: hypothetical protein PHR22_01035 [Candidatus Omnitrophica bacterium]|nr:hypothetical protein [Candidatus Omnitrophota bacterium]